MYVKKALEDNYLCRSAYKLIELDDKFHFLQPGRVVIDCGASPGNFLITVQVSLLLNTILITIAQVSIKIEVASRFE